MECGWWDIPSKWKWGWVAIWQRGVGKCTPLILLSWHWGFHSLSHRPSYQSPTSLQLTLSATHPLCHFHTPLPLIFLILSIYQVPTSLPFPHSVFLPPSPHLSTIHTSFWHPITHFNPFSLSNKIWLHVVSLRVKQYSYKWKEHKIKLNLTKLVFYSSSHSNGHHGDHTQRFGK